MSARLAQIQAFLAQNPHDSFLRFALAKEYESLGEGAQARATYEALRQDDPAYVGLYYHLGKLCERLQDPEAALAAYRAGMAEAERQGDRHAWSELSAAKLELADDED